MIAQVQLTLRGSLDPLRIVWQTGETLLESVDFEQDAESGRYNVLVAVQEMLTNVLRYGIAGDAESQVQVDFLIAEVQVEIVIRDRGPEFNPLERGELPVEAGDGPLPEHGYGIHIARSVMDEVGYTRDRGWNVLRMTRRVCASAESAGSIQQG